MKIIIDERNTIKKESEYLNKGCLMSELSVKKISAKKSIIFSLLVLFTLFLSYGSQVQGHDPAEVRLHYYYAEQILEV